MIQIWIKSDANFDLMHTNDQGEDYNMSKAVRDMNRKIAFSIVQANLTLIEPVEIP